MKKQRTAGPALRLHRETLARLQAPLDPSALKKVAGGKTEQTCPGWCYNSAVTDSCMGGC